ncbi:hypothetical protein [Komagataeibacter sp. NFXK3]
MAHQSGPDIVAEHSCFDGQRVSASERAALEATVYLYVASPDGKNDISGSGTVLRDSRTPQGHNRILTIRHVTQHALRKHGRIYVLDRFGHKLSEARQTPATILSESQLAQEPDSGVHDLPGDNAVLLDMQPRTPAYDQISGVDVAPRLYRGIMYAWFTDPGALMPGVSGAALLNEHNQVIGIAEGTGGGDNQHSHAFVTQVSAHDIQKVFERQDTGENTIGSATFFHGSIAAFMPLSCRWQVLAYRRSCTCSQPLPHRKTGSMFMFSDTLKNCTSPITGRSRPASPAPCRRWRGSCTI